MPLLLTLGPIPGKRIKSRTHTAPLLGVMSSCFYHLISQYFHAMLTPSLILQTNSRTMGVSSKSMGAHLFPRIWGNVSAILDGNKSRTEPMVILCHSSQRSRVNSAAGIAWIHGSGTPRGPSFYVTSSDQGSAGAALGLKGTPIRL